MKRIFTLLALTALTLSILAQSPDLMSYQAVLRDAEDHLLINQAVAVQISILQGAPNGTAVYTEVHSLSTNDNGLISLMIGDGVTSDDFSTIDWGAGPYYIKTETDPAGGSNYTITSTTQLVSVPYALHSRTAENISGTLNETDPVYTAEAPGVDFVEDGSGGLVSTSSGTSSMASVVVSVPGPGYVIVHASGSLYHSVTSTTDHFLARIKVSDAANDVAESPGIQFIRAYGYPTTGVWLYPFSTAKVFQVNSSGDYTYYLNAWHQTVNGTLTLDDYTLIAQYVPNRY